MAMELTTAFANLGISLGLGLLVGLQREREKSRIAGFRTFPLITLAGTMSAMMSVQLGGWIVAAALLVVAAAMFVGNMSLLRDGEDRAGITTEIAIVVMFLVGAWLGVNDLPREVAVAVGTGAAILLHLKATLHGLASKIGDADIRAIMQFALITFIILPVLPNDTFGPFDVLNPRQIWLMVVLVVAMSLGGYIAYKLVGERAGTVLGGIIGGLISSTATTVTAVRRAAHSEALHHAAMLMIMLATAVMYGRVLVELAVIAPDHLAGLAPPIVIMLLTTMALCVMLWLRSARDAPRLPEQGNPTELKSALMFGGLFAVVIFAVAAAKHYFGDRGIYVVAVLSGLTDMDAITLSTARMLKEGRLNLGTTWHAILIASIANLSFKSGIALVLGGRKLFIKVLGLTAVSAIVAVALILFYPTTEAPA